MEFEKYRKLVLSCNDLDAQVSHAILTSVFDFFAITQEVYNEAYHAHTGTEAFETANKQCAERPQPTKLSRQQTMQLFDFEMRLKHESLGALRRVRDSEFACEYEVQSALQCDRMHWEFGVEQHVYNEALAQHDLLTDPYVLEQISLFE